MVMAGGRNWLTVVLLTSSETLLTIVSRQMIILAIPFPLSIDVFAMKGQLGARAVERIEDQKYSYAIIYSKHDE